jgi:magnesium chelatase family protein
LQNNDRPSEDGVVTISRAAGQVTYPAKFILVAASNPCPCGYYGDPKRQCRCLPGQINRYQKRVSGPIIDRIDLHLEVPAVKVEKLVTTEARKAKENTESSRSIKKRVQRARNLQTKRFIKTKLKSNAEMNTREVKKFCPLSNDCLTLLRQAVSQMSLSARAYYRVIKLSRTIADLAGEKRIIASHIAEALQYRPRESDSLP